MSDFEHMAEPSTSSSPAGRVSPGSARWRRLAVLATVTVIVCGGPVYLYTLRAGTAAAAPPTTPTTAALDAPYKSEEDWLVTRIVEDLWGMAAFASGRVNPAPIRIAASTDATGLVALRVSPAQGSVWSGALRLEHSVWSPEDYQALAANLLRSEVLRPAASELPAAAQEEDESLLRHLLDRRAEVIEDENWAISRELARQPSDPRSHERAALLLGAFGLREAPGEFSDVRAILCRMTAHLALARALRGSAAPSLNGRYAQAVLNTLSDRGAAAEADLQRLDASAVASHTQEAWRRALRLRLSEDWRLLPHPEQATLLEQLEWLRATQSTLQGERGLQILARAGFQPPQTVDWALALAWMPSVGIGNAYFDAGFDALLTEMDEIWRRNHEARFPPKERVAVLNEPMPPFSPTDRQRVIAWGTWAAYYQRHVLLLLQRIEGHERYGLGLEDVAKRTAAEKTREFSRLTLFPLLAAGWEIEKKEPDAQVVAAALDLVLKHPEFANGAIWSSLVHRSVNLALPRRLPAAGTWFRGICPRGTVYDLAERHSILLQTGGPSRSEVLARWKAISPRDYIVGYYRIYYTHLTPPPPAEIEAELGDHLEYDLRAIYWYSELAYEQGDALVRRLNERMCTIDPVKCDQLAAWCVDQNDEACAVSAYERFVSEAADDVSVSNSSRWLLRYYLRRGERGRARALAQRADAVGSSGGFLAMAAYLEAAGAYAEAEERIAAERDRYPREGEPHWDLIAFYHRMAHVRGVRSYEAKFATLTKDIFARGLERATLASLPTPPTDGVLFVTETPALRRNGMYKGDVAVAWDGWRIRDSKQFTAVRAFDDDPSFKLIVWRSGKYIEVSARRQGRRFGMSLADYKPKTR